MDSFTATTKILNNLKIKYRHMDNIMNLTKELEKAMMANDSVSFSSVLDMRGDVMILVDKIDQENQQIISRLPSSMRERISAIVLTNKNTNGETLVLDNPLETNIYDTNKGIISLLTKIIKLDTDINERIKG